MDNKNIVAFFKLFDGRPNHLVKFLIDNNALNSSFIKKLTNSSKLEQLELNDNLNEIINFKNIDEMNSYYQSFIDDSDNKKKKSKKFSNDELKDQIFNAIKNENYEEAARIRDFIIKNNLNKK